MKNSMFDNHSKRGYIIRQTNIIADLIENGKVKHAQWMIDDLVENFPDDPFIKISQARIYMFMRMFKEAYELFKSADREEYLFMFLTVLSIKLGYLEDAKYYYYKYFRSYRLPVFFQNDVAYRIYQIHLQKMFEPDKLEIRTTDSYNMRQEINYSKEEAIKHIIDHHQSENAPEENLFNPEIDIKQLYEQIKKLIEENPDECSISKFHQIYNVKYPNAGNNRNYIVVGTIINSSNIITMYPKETGSEFGTTLEFETDKIERPKELKRISQIDKFYQRYGKK